MDMTPERAPTLSPPPAAPAPSVAPAPAIDHPTPDASGKTAAEYAYEAMKLHNAQYHKGKAPPALLKWWGDASLAVLPMNRMYCAIGLTTGQILGGTLGSWATGYSLLGKPIEKASVPTFLQGMHKMIPGYNGPKALDSRSRWIKYAQWGVFSLGGLLGAKAGTDYAYKNVHVRNKDPHYIEEYMARVSMHQGATWSWLASLSSIFGSASGLFMLPIPGLNYGLGLAARTTSMQDRNFMITGMNDLMSGASTPSYLRLKEGLNYLCHYAVGNPAQTPSQIEYLAFTMLGPVFKNKLTPKHIQQFTEAVHAVRDRYWQPGGIPKEKRQEALYTMKEVMTGAGLEVLLIDMGLNPGTIAFGQLNGLTGKIGNVGVMKLVEKEQEAYLAALESRLQLYVTDGEISQDRADWVRAGILAMKQGKPQPPAPEPAPAVEEVAPEMPHMIERVVEAGERFQNKKPTTYSDQMNTRLKTKPGRDSIRTLVDKALEDPKRDWREVALGQKQNTADVIRGE